MDTKLRESRDFVEKLERATGGTKPVSATYTAQVNAELLALARDGLRYRMMRHHALTSAEHDSALKTESFVGEIDRYLVEL